MRHLSQETRFANLCFWTYISSNFCRALRAGRGVAGGHRARVHGRHPGRARRRVPRWKGFAHMAHHVIGCPRLIQDTWVQNVWGDVVGNICPAVLGGGPGPVAFLNIQTNHPLPSPSAPAPWCTGNQPRLVQLLLQEAPAQTWVLAAPRAGPWAVGRGPWAGGRGTWAGGRLPFYQRENFDSPALKRVSSTP